MPDNALTLCALSDSHGYSFSIPKCDIFCHCGDWSPLRIQCNYEAMFEWLESFVEFLCNLPCRYVVLIAGNHDNIMRTQSAETVFDDLQEKLGAILTYVDADGVRHREKKVHYLRENTVELLGVKFWGSPVTRQINPYRKYWAFENNRPMYPIPEDADVILTHMPSDCEGLGTVHNDSQRRANKLGCPYLTSAVTGSHAKYHFCGHIHTGNHQGCTYPNGTIGVNVSMLDESYEKAYEPYLCEYPPKGTACE